MRRGRSGFLGFGALSGRGLTDLGAQSAPKQFAEKAVIEISGFLRDLCASSATTALKMPGRHRNENSKAGGQRQMGVSIR
jgi:hypothetical protein